MPITRFLLSLLIFQVTDIIKINVILVLPIRIVNNYIEKLTFYARMTSVGTVM